TLAFATSALLLHHSRPPPDLHSFPTRRSSDLSEPSMIPKARSRGLQIGVCAAQRVFGAFHEIGHDFRSRPYLVNETHALPCETRSEEHTSELQSRENLVCRLLLEKKK